MRSICSLYWLSKIADDLDAPSFQLGCSPAEELGSPEVRELSWAEHDATPELRLWEDGFSQL